MANTPNLALPYILAAQSQKHVTHNEAIRALDAVAQISVLDRDLATPPGSPAEGARYIIAASPTGAWAGHATKIAAWQDGAWAFYAPKEGWLAWVADEDELLVWSGTAWVDATPPTSLNPTPLVGVNATADTTNRLAVSSAASLFNHAGNGHQVKVNKNAAGDTASFLFQTAFSGRAEMGTTGDDDFHFKVSANGSTFKEGIKIDKSTGRVSFPSGGAREQLGAARTYYVRTDGNDANTGLVNSAAGAFLTLQRAVEVAMALDLGGFIVTIQLGAGTYTAGASVLGPYVGNGFIHILGDAATPSNVIVSTTGSNCFHAYYTYIIVEGVELRTTTGGDALFVDAAAWIDFANVRFGACAGAHMWSQFGGVCQAVGNYTISGAAQRHMRAEQGGRIRVPGITATLSGTPAFSSEFASAAAGGGIRANGNTYTGAATGKRYDGTLNGVIDTGGGGANYFPGNAAGTTATGGQYV